MTAIQLKAEIAREMDIYADNEDILQKVLDYFRALTRKKPDPTEMTEAEFFAKIDRSLQQAERGEVYSPRPDETFDQFFTRLHNELHG